MIERLSEQHCFGGIQASYRHDSQVTGLPMRFSVFHPPAESRQPVPVLVWLAGLTCTEETFMIKAGAQRVAAECGLMLVAPDTSPRATGIAGATDDWDFGEGAGFWLDATSAPWSTRFRMESYLLQELLPLVFEQFNDDHDRVGIFGHSMGGHGALTLAFRHPGRFRSVSAFAPISSPTRCPWGKKAFSRYLGNDVAAWARHDAAELIRARGSALFDEILVDQGSDDKFLDDQLLPQELESACRSAGQPLTLRMQPGYDHSYFFIQTFMEDHLRLHQRVLSAPSDAS